ncbi:MAG: RING finger domain-containing protein [Promethearchaeia archaeon]
MSNLKLINNIFNTPEKITGFTKDEILAAKKNLEQMQESKQKSDELEEYLEELYPQEFLDKCKTYLSQLKDFLDNYIQMDREGKEDIYFFVHLKSALIDELDCLSSNLLNFKRNSQNVDQFIKQKNLIEEKKSLSKKLHKIAESLKKRVENLTSEEKIKKYNDLGYIWNEANQIKQNLYRLIKEPQALLKWDEISEIVSVIKKIKSDAQEEESKKRFSLFSKKEKESEKEKGIRFPIRGLTEELDNICDSEELLEVFKDLIHLLYVNSILKESQYYEVAQSQQQEIKRKLKAFFEDLIKSVIKNYLSSEIKKVTQFNQQYKILPEEEPFSAENIGKLGINEFLPRIFKFYFEGIEQSYQEKIDTLQEQENFEDIINSYQDDMAQLTNSYNKLDEKVEELALFTYPFQEIIEPTRKILENIEDSISRREETYIDYLKTLRTEKIRDDAREYIEEKKGALNSLIDEAKDKSSAILQGEFPQLKKLRTVLAEYRQKIKDIKEEVYSKLDTFKENNVDMYQQIKFWEKNITVKQNQLNFILSMIFKRLYKNFKELIDSEGMLFDSASDMIADSGEGTMPINFALSNFLVDKLTEEELKDRISEVKTQIQNSEKALELYKSELDKLEARMTEKVKKREGIDKNEMKCTVCRQMIKVGKDKIIVCPFCKNAYHYLCVADWLTNYNSCPICQNKFLDPNNGLYHIEEENYE